MRPGGCILFYHSSEDKILAGNVVPDYIPCDCYCKYWLRDWNKIGNLLRLMKYFCNFAGLISK